MTKTIIDELIEFAEELTLLIKQDWEKSKQFIKKHKTYFFWILALFVSMQFTDILSLGKSWDIYCKKHNIQSGGGNTNAPPPLPPPRVNRSSKPKGADGESSKGADVESSKGADGESSKGADGESSKGADGESSKGADGESQKGTDGAKQGEEGSKGTGAGAGSPTSAGQPQRMRTRSQGLMGQSRIGRSQSRFARTMRRNPVFGNLDKIFNMTQGMFALVMFILVIVGVLSLPVIIFIIITYCIIKNLCSRLAIL